MNLLQRLGVALRAGALAFRRNAVTALSTRLPRSRIDFNREIGQGLGSPAVLAVVGWIARNWIDAPIRVRQLLSDPTAEPIDVRASEFGPGAMLSLLKRPNPFYTGRTLMKAAVVDYATTGSAYIYKRRNDAGRVMELWWLPQVMTRPRWPEDDDTVFIGWYEYNPNGIPYVIRPEDVIHLRDGMDPLNPRVGLSKVGALAREIFTDDEAANFSAAVVANFGPPGVVIAPREVPQGSNVIADPETVKQKYIETFGGDNRGQPMVMSGPTTVDVVSWNPEQMQLKALRRIPEERISAVFGPAAIVAGLGAGLDRSTFANFAEARSASYEECILPGHSDWAEQLQFQLLSEWADPLRYVVDFDYSNVRALQEDQTAVWTRHLDAWRAGAITRATFKQAVGIEHDDAFDDVYAVPFNVNITPATEAVVPAEPPPSPGATASAPVNGTNGNGHGVAALTETVPV